MNGSFRLGLVNLGLLAVVAVLSLMATCSNSRLEEQVIRLRKAVEAGGSGSAAPYVGGASSAAPQLTGEPGSPTGFEASGWGGRRAPIQIVEGSAPDAPRTLAQKPRPQGDWFVNRRTSPPRSLNYYATNEGDAERIASYVLGRLMNMDYDAPPNVVPELATSWTVADDKLTYTYKLRRGVQFGDGRPFTAADVKFSFDVMRDPEVRADHMRSAFDDVESLETPDDYTVVVKYRRKYWKGLYAIGYTLRVLNKGWYEEQIPVYAKKLGIAKFATEPGKPGFGKVFNDIRIPCPGTGPYYVRSDDDFTDQTVILVQNPFWCGTQLTPTWYNFAQLRWVFISDDVAAFEAFRKTDFDVTVVDADRWEDQLRGDPSIEKVAKHFSYDHTGLDCSYIGWNCRKPPFDDPRVRKAMTHLVDRQWILDEIERGRGTIAVCKSKRMYPTYSNDIEPWPFDPERAKQLLAEAGWRDTDGDGILDRDGRRFEFELKVPSGRTFYTRVGGAIADACKSVGIRMHIRALEWATFFRDYEERNFDAVCLYSSWSDPWIDLYEQYHSSQDVPAGGNAPGWRNAQVDRLVEAMREEFDEEQRTRMFHDFNRIFHDEQPETLLVHGMVDVLVNRRFEELKVRPTGLQIFELWVRPENVIHR